MNDKKRMIKEAALRVIVKNGLYKSPTSLIAKEAGVATGTLFNYFKTKDILLDEIFNDLKNEEKETRQLLYLNDELSLEERLWRIWENIIKWRLNNPEKAIFFDIYKEFFIEKNIREDSSFKAEWGNHAWNTFKGILSDDEEGRKKAKLLLFLYLENIITAYRLFKYNGGSYDKKTSKTLFDILMIGILKKGGKI